MAEIRIRCPACAWEPDGGAYWQCHCGHIWDTFETAAKCPACGFQHKDTQCIQSAGGCSKISPHLKWYENLDDIYQEAMESEGAEK
jgi:hypothetical protein